MTTLGAATHSRTKNKKRKLNHYINIAFEKESYSSFLQQCHLPAVKTNQVVMPVGEMRQLFKSEPEATLFWELTRASHNKLLGFLLPLQNLPGKGLSCNMCFSYRELISDCNLVSCQKMFIHIKRNSLAHPYQPTSSYNSSSTAHSLLPVVSHGSQDRFD